MCGCVETPSCMSKTRHHEEMCGEPRMHHGRLLFLLSLVLPNSLAKPSLHTKIPQDVLDQASNQRTRAPVKRSPQGDKQFFRNQRGKLGELRRALLRTSCSDQELSDLGTVLTSMSRWEKQSPNYTGICVAGRQRQGLPTATRPRWPTTRPQRHDQVLHEQTEPPPVQSQASQRCHLVCSRVIHGKKVTADKCFSTTVSSALKCKDNTSNDPFSRCQSVQQFGYR